MSLTKVSYSMIQGEVINFLDYGAVGNTNIATYVGTDDTAAIQAAIDYAIATAQVAKGGVTLYLPSGGYLLTSTINIDTTGVSFLRIIGNGQSSRFIYTGTGKAFNFIGSTFDNDYAKLNSRIQLENFMVFGLPSEVSAGATFGLSFIQCAEIKCTNVMVHYFNQGWYLKDTPNVFLTNCEAISNNKGWSFKKTTLFPNSDLADINITNPIGAGNVIDLYIDGCRQLNVFGGFFGSDQCVNIRATGSTNTSDQVEGVFFFGTFFDYADLTTATISIGNAADTTYQIKTVQFNGCFFASSPSFTKAIIYCDSPLLGHVSVNGGECAETTPKFLVIGGNCSTRFSQKITDLGANGCMNYRVTDERSATVRTELFEQSTSLQLNPDFYYYATAYAPLGYDLIQPANTGRDTVNFVTGDASIALFGAGSPSPAASPVWYPNFGDMTVTQGTDLVIEWIVKTATTAPAATLIINTTNIDGSGAASTIADVLLTSTVQLYSNGFVRLMHPYKVPINKVVTSILVRGAVGENVLVDYFNVYGPNQYLSSEALYIGVAADLANAAFTLAKFRGVKAQLRSAGVADSIYACRKDAGATYSWNLIV